MGLRSVWIGFNKSKTALIVSKLKSSCFTCKADTFLILSHNVSCLVVKSYGIGSVSVFCYI